jgi:hypothetical protein
MEGLKEPRETKKDSGLRDHIRKRNLPLTKQECDGRVPSVSSACINVSSSFRGVALSLLVQIVLVPDEAKLFPL